MEGFEIPIHRALTVPILVAGVPREFAIFNGTIAAAFVFGMHNFLAIPLALIAHLLAVPLTKKDPQFMLTYKRHLRQRGYYDV